MKKGLIRGEDGLDRCWWHGEHQDYIDYHDYEWGFPVDDDQRLYEKICLEGFQSGLSWLTILRKRDNFRHAFADFDFYKVAKFTEEDVERLLQDKGIVRHRRKIESTINNAQRAVELIAETGTLAAYFWSFEPKASERPKRLDYESLASLAQTPFSKALSTDLKKRGWKFIGPTTAYAFMQAMGVVNDHLEGCHCREKALKARADFLVPVMK